MRILSVPPFSIVGPAYFTFGSPVFFVGLPLVAAPPLVALPAAVVALVPPLAALPLAVVAAGAAGALVGAVVAAPLAAVVPAGFGVSVALLPPHAARMAVIAAAA